MWRRDVKKSGKKKIDKNYSVLNTPGFYIYEMVRCACDVGCNSLVLFIVSTIATIMAEICFVPMLALVKYRIPDSNQTFCWSWDFASKDADFDGKCPFLLLFISALVIGVLLVATSLCIVLKKCTDCKLDGVLCCRFMLKYGAFVLNFLAFLLVLIFIILIGVFADIDSGPKEVHFTGALLSSRVPLHYRFILVCVGAFMTLVATVLSGLLSFRYARPATDEYFEGGLFHGFTDYARTEYEQIN